MLKLTKENYFSPTANLEYMSVSQYKSWLKCPASTLHWLTADVAEKDTESLIVGRYVHAWSESSTAFEEFKNKYSDFIFNKKGTKYAPFLKADEMINCLDSDPKIKFYLSGSKEVILTAELFGVPWKIMIDIDNDSLNYLADLKTTKSISEWGWVWSPDESRNIKVPFIEEWQYMIQASVYSEVERIARGREKQKDFYMIAVSKEKIPDHAIIDLTDPVRMEAELAKIELNLPHIMAVKSGKEEPTRCGHCDYCRSTKKVDKIIHYTELREMY